MKLEAKHGSRLRTLCGDDDKLIKQTNLAFSDARGVVGFLTRLDQHRTDPARAKNYLDGVMQLYKLSTNTTVDQAVQRLKIELKNSVVHIKQLIERRNQILADKLSSSKESVSAVVYGGMHAPGLVALLESAGIDCTVVEPNGYQDDEVELMRRLDRALVE